MYYRVYRITHTASCRSYIGCTFRSIERRWIEHCQSKHSIHPLHQAINEFGRDTFSVSCLLEGATENDAFFAERYFMERLQTFVPMGFNLRPRHYKRADRPIPETVKIALEALAIGQVTQ